MINQFKKRATKFYSKDSAGAKMTKKVPSCGPLDNIEDVKRKLSEDIKELETINYVYVVEKDKLAGVFSIKDVFRRREKERVQDFMVQSLVKIEPRDDQEKAAFLAIKHNLKAIPVVDKDGFFLGVVSSDNILDILHKEHLEDLLISAGINKQEEFSSKITGASVNLLAKIRLPWLIVGLFGGVLAAQVTVFFEKTLSSYFILAAFIPLIVYMADAVGAQTQTLYIRSLAVNHFSQKNYFLKEIKVGILVSLALSILIFIVTLMMSGILLISVVLGISLFLTILTAVAISIFIPHILLRAGKDPALGSGPFGTIIADISSLIIYFSVANFFIKFFS